MITRLQLLNLASALQKRSATKAAVPQIVQKEKKKKKHLSWIGSVFIRFRVARFKKSS